MAIIGVLAALALSACEEEKPTRIGDARIIEKLNLEQLGEGEDGYAIDGDPFCLVTDSLLNSADEVDNGRGLVVASRAGNVGVEGLTPFAPDCRESARKKLDKLDPPAAN